MNWLFAPRIDHRGWQTPSEASRIFLIITLLMVGWWYWESTHENLAIWIGMTILVSTPILTIGWYLLSLVAKNRDVQLLTPKVCKHLEEKGRLPPQINKP